MEATDAILNRVSSPRLTGEVPDWLVKEMVAAARRAPDHAQLRPYRFLCIEGDGRGVLGDLMVKARQAADPDVSSDSLEKLRLKPFRAPMIIVGIAAPKPHPKVPEIEQLLTAGIALQQMSSLAYARGYGAMWRTGVIAYSKEVARGLGLSEDESIVGFLYLGEIEGRLKTPSMTDPEDLLRSWP